ncbi:hypothetical protein [Nonomuraea endophytica]|uniref:hypothetical protein n=1 Tax=Nonomuraea endophytica TaxID=714136 RepID=UPI0037CB62F8
MSDYVCGGCGQAEGHPESCDLGGYATREQLVWEHQAELAHEQEHLRGSERVDGCDHCLLDPPSFGIRVTPAGQRELREAQDRYRTRQTTLAEYDAERAAAIAAHPA